MHESTIKLMSTPVSTLPTLINEHINEYLYGAYNVSTKDFKNLVNTMHSCIPVVIHYIAQGNTPFVNSIFKLCSTSQPTKWRRGYA